MTARTERQLHNVRAQAAGEGQKGMRKVSRA
jgi:hypothetical protein